MEPKPGTRTRPAGREDRPILVLEKRADGTISILKNTLYTLETPDTESLFALAEADNREYGKLPEEHLRFLKDHTAPDGTVRYAFGDTYSEEQSLHRQITASLLIGTGAFLIFLIFAVWFSGWAVKPVEEAWKRQRPVCGRCLPRVKDTANRHFIQCGTDCSITGTDRPGGQTPYRLYSGGGRTDERTCGRAFVPGTQ